MEEFKEEISFGKKVIYWIIGLSILLSIGGFILNKATVDAMINEFF